MTFKLAKYFFLLFVVVIAVSCDKQQSPPTDQKEVLLSETASGLPKNVYQEIIKNKDISIAAINEIMKAVKEAIRLHPANDAARNHAIERAVFKHSKNVQWANNIKAAAFTRHDVLLSFAESGLSHQSIYLVIRDHAKASVAQKNSLMKAVKAAMEDPAKNQTKRDKLIDDAVLAHGNYPNFATQIKAAVDLADPLIISEAEAGLPHDVYEVIAKDNGTTVPNKNLIIAAVKAALDNPVKDQNARDQAIDDAVLAHGNSTGLADKIKKEVDIADPIPVVVFTQAESGLKQSIYDVIFNSAASNLEKNRIMKAVKLAIEAPFSDQNTRDLAIERAIKNNGAHVNLAKDIKAAVDIEHPIANAKLLKELCDAFDEGTGGTAKVVINKGAPVNGSCGAKSVFEKMVSSVNAPEQREELLILMLQKGLTLSNTYAKLNVDGLGEIKNATLLSYAIRENFSGAVRELGLLFSDAQLQALNHQGLNPLHYAAFFNSYKSAEALVAEYLKRSISLDILSGNVIPSLTNKTALEIAQLKGNQETIDVLTKAKTPPVLLTLAESGLEQIIYDVIKNHGAASILEKNGIMRAVKAALDKPADLTQRDKDILDAVNANGGYVGFAQAITDAVDEAKPIGTRALCKALLANNGPLALEKVVGTPVNGMCSGPDEDIFSRMVRTITKVSDRGKLLSLLVRHTLDLKKVYPVLPTVLAGDLKNQTVIKYAIRENLRLPLIDIMSRLKDKKDLTARSQGLSILHYAAFLGSDKAALEIVGEFLRRGIPLDEKTDAGAPGGLGNLSAREIAQAKGHAAVVDILDNPVPVIYSRDDIDLDQDLYNVIALHAAPVPEKNAMLRSVKELLSNHQDHSVRRFFINKAIEENPGFAGQYAAIRNAVDLAYPLATMPATALKGVVLEEGKSGRIDATTKLPTYLFLEVEGAFPWMKEIVYMHPDQYRGYKPTYGDTVYFETLTAKTFPTPDGRKKHAKNILGVQ